MLRIRLMKRETVTVRKRAQVEAGRPLPPDAEELANILAEALVQDIRKIEVMVVAVTRHHEKMK